MKKRVLVEIICLLFIFLFVYAAVSKLTDIQKFQITIGQSPLLVGIAAPVSWAVPISEIMISVLLVFPRTRLIGLVASFGLMVMFTAYIFIIMNFHEHIPCSCGGILQRMAWGDHFIFNLAFVVLGAIGTIVQFQDSSVGLGRKDILLQ